MWTGNLYKFLELKDSTGWLNNDITPMPPHRRTWGTISYLGFWSIANINISCWMSASSLIDLGFSIGQVFSVVVVGNFIVVLYTLLVSYQGAKWHISYTVTQRVVFGVYGAYISVIIRVFLSMTWYGAQSWIGGQCISAILSTWSHSYFKMKNTFPDSLPMTTRDLIGFVIFHVISWPLLCINPERINKPTVIANISAFIAMLVVCIVCGIQTDKLHHLRSWRNPAADAETSFGWRWLYGLTTWIGALSTSVVCQSDFTRFSKRPFCSFPGTIIAFAVFGLLIPCFGIIVAFATKSIYDEHIWNPVDLAMKWLESSGYSSGSRAGAFFFTLAILLSQFCVNTLTNGFTGGMDLSGMLPRFINIKRGGIIVSLLSWALRPWEFYNTSSTFLTVMSSFSVYLSPLIGIMICDFYIVRLKRTKLSDCYTSSKNGAYWYTYGVNLRTLIAWFSGMALAIPGMANQVTPTINIPTFLLRYYQCQSLIGVVLGFLVYWVLCICFPIKKAREIDDCDVYRTFTEEEAGKIDIPKVEKIFN